MADSPYKTTQWRKLRPAIFERDRGICQAGCGKELDPDGEYDIDHIVPWSEGGAWFDPANLRLACWQCNRSRGAKRMKLAARINRATPPEPSRRW